MLYKLPVASALFPLCHSFHHIILLCKISTVAFSYNVKLKLASLAWEAYTEGWHSLLYLPSPRFSPLLNHSVPVGVACTGLRPLLGVFTIVLFFFSVYSSSCRLYQCLALSQPSGSNLRHGLPRKYHFTSKTRVRFSCYQLSRQL